jgi:hexokinase
MCYLNFRNQISFKISKFNKNTLKKEEKSKMDHIELKLSCQEKTENVRNLLSGFFIQQDRLDKLQSAFRSELEAGLKEGLSGSCLQMENTYVPELPNGKEEGTYLALDLGGTNFRVMLMEMKSGKITREEVAYYTVQEKTRLGPGTLNLL